MRVVERPFSDFLRQPNSVLAELAEHDVVLRRRNAPALRLSEADRAEERDEAVGALARLVRNLLSSDKTDLDTTLIEVFPWATFLPAKDRALFLEEFVTTLLASSSIGSFTPVGRLLAEWKATAEIHADPRLAQRLRQPLETQGEPVPAPAP